MNEPAQIEFEELHIDYQQLRALPEEIVAAFSVLCFISSEINVLRKNYLSVTHQRPDDQAIDIALRIHQLTTLRTWSSKLFEAIEFIEQLQRGRDGVQGAELKKWLNEATKSLEKLKAEEGFSVARYVRNEVAHHYSFKAAKNNLKFVPPEFDCNIYTHDNGGNDFFPLGEGVLFHARLNRKWSNVRSTEERNSKFEGWLYWCLNSTNFFLELNARFANEWVFSELDNPKFQSRTYSIDKRMIDLNGTSKAPIFYKRPKEPAPNTEAKV